MNLLSGEQVLQELIAGNRRYVAGRATRPNQDPDTRQRLVQGQHPRAVILTCADSRVPPEIVFDCGLGELFVVRVAGNIADDTVIASIEYAARHLGVPLVVVMGHSHCGAVNAAVAAGSAEGHLPGLLQAISPAVERARRLVDGGTPAGEVAEKATRIHVAMVTEQLRHCEPVLSWLVQESRLRIMGALYHLESGMVEFPEAKPGLEAYLEERESRYEPEVHMLGSTWHGPGYHSRVADGTWVHPTRDNLDYALALLVAGGWEREGRARAVIQAVLDLQDTNPAHATYGIWPWLLEEPLQDMAPPDWNWADFCGARLAQILADHQDQLTAELCRAVQVSLGHAAWSIYRRNVGPEYTNIAIMGAGVTLAAGELLGEPRLSEYGRARLRRFAQHTRMHGGLNEYNSPTYTMVALHECERILQLVADEDARAIAERLRGGIWDSIAAHYHPPTGQWAGPHSRAYKDLLDPCTRHELLVGAGVPQEETLPYADVQHLPCPDNAAAAFRSLGPEEIERHHAFVRGATWNTSRWGVTWMNQTACLGSINHEDTWTQRRVLLGYWTLGTEVPAVLRLRFLRDGRDFASGCVYQSQHRNRVLTALGMRLDRGDFHVHLDRPADGIFQAADIRLRYELTAPEATVADLGAARYALAASAHRAVVHTAPGRFGDAPVRWETGAEEGRAWVDAVCYSGATHRLNPRTLAAVMVAAGVQLLGLDQAPSDMPVRLEDSGTGEVQVQWDKVGRLTVPLRASTG